MPAHEFCPSNMNAQVTTLKLADIDVQVTFKNVKNINLRICPPDGQVRVSAPKKLNRNVLKKFILSKQAWIKAQQTRMRNRPREATRCFADSESHYFNGKSHLLKVIEHHGRPRIEKKRQTLQLYLRPGTPPEQRETMLNEWYRQQLKITLPRLIAHYEPVMGVKVNEFGIKRMKTRWGTCNTHAKRIWLNLELAKKPPECLEYVVVHEMVHLLERSHNHRFVGFMNQFMPEWRHHKKTLNDFPSFPEN